MIQLLDIEDSSEDTPRRCKGIIDKKKKDLIKDYAKRHDTEISLISRHSSSSQLSEDKIQENSHDDNATTSDSEESDEVVNEAIVYFTVMIYLVYFEWHVDGVLGMCK